jgi:hypothetical protein
MFTILITICIMGSPIKPTRIIGDVIPAWIESSNDKSGWLKIKIVEI